MTFYRDDEFAMVRMLPRARRAASSLALVGQLALATTLLASFTACASGDAPDPLTKDGQEAADLAQSVAESSAKLRITLTEPEYFAAVRDMRRCASPLCGGFFVRAVNRASTRCADGTIAERCYVAELDLSVFGEEPPALGWETVLRGRIESKFFPVFGNLGEFVATEAYSSATRALGTGVHFRLADNGIRCITTPCFSISAELLNTSLQLRLSNLDLSPVNADPEALQGAVEALTDGNLVASGRLRLQRGMGGMGLELVSSQFYLPLGERCFADADCARTEYCNAIDVCLPPPGCRRGEQCPAVCTGYCVSDLASAE